MCPSYVNGCWAYDTNCILDCRTLHQGVSQLEVRVALTSGMSEVQVGGRGLHFSRSAVRDTLPNLEWKLLSPNYLGNHEPCQADAGVRLTESPQGHAPQAWQGHCRAVNSGALASSNSCPFQVYPVCQIPCRFLESATIPPSGSKLGSKLRRMSLGSLPAVLRGPEWEVA